MPAHASTHWFAKADECLAEARRLHEGGFHAGACSRAINAMMFAAKAGLKHGMIEGYVHVAMPTIRVTPTRSSRKNSPYTASLTHHFFEITAFRHCRLTSIEC
jgi:hypothetical protein